MEVKINSFSRFSRFDDKITHEKWWIFWISIKVNI
jgi:hypothetical protein